LVKSDKLLALLGGQLPLKEWFALSLSASASGPIDGRPTAPKNSKFLSNIDCSINVCMFGKNAVIADIEFSGQMV
jgi:hypothetical protein